MQNGRYPRGSFSTMNLKHESCWLLISSFKPPLPLWGEGLGEIKGPTEGGPAFLCHVAEGPRGQLFCLWLDLLAARSLSPALGAPGWLPRNPSAGQAPGGSRAGPRQGTGVPSATVEVTLGAEMEYWERAIH